MKRITQNWVRSKLRNVDIKVQRARLEAEKIARSRNGLLKNLNNDSQRHNMVKYNETRRDNRSLKLRSVLCIDSSTKYIYFNVQLKLHNIIYIRFS